MSYLVLCTFDLEGAESDDYQNAYEALESIGLYITIKNSKGKEIDLPNTVTVGKFNGESAESIANDISNKVKKAFNQLKLKSDIFISVGGDWAWINPKTP